MAYRFPLRDAPDPTGRDAVEQSITNQWKGYPQFPLIEDDKQAMLGHLAPLRFVSSTSKYTKIRSSLGVASTLLPLAFDL